MPGPQLHLPYGERVAHHPRVVAAVRQAVAREPVYTHLGSIFHDLPFYGNMIAEAVRYGLNRPAIDAPWAYRVHSLYPDRFAASFVRAARTTQGLSRDERLALIAGLFSHCALDLSLHPLVNYCARRDVLLFGGYESVHHRMTEKYHALFCNIDMLGDDVVGSPDFARKAIVTKRGHLVGGGPEPEILALMQAAYGGAYGEAPSTRRWAAWVRHFRDFGRMVSGPLARRNSLRAREKEHMRAHYFTCDQFDFRDFFAVAERRCAELVNLAYDYFEAGDFSPEAETAFRTAARIDDLAASRLTEVPVLPALPATPLDVGLPQRRVHPLREIMRLRRPSGHNSGRAA